MSKSYTIKIAHAHLKVRDLERALDFYTRFFDLNIVERVGNHYAFLSGGGFHHEIALQNVGQNAPIPASNGTGLYHIAFEVPDKRAFGLAYQALRDAGVKVGAVNHLISWAMYFDDPDGNGLEIYTDIRHLPEGVPLWQGQNVHLPDDTIFAEITA